MSRRMGTSVAQGPCASIATQRPWRDWSVVLVYSAATGLLVVGFTMLSDAASDVFRSLEHLDGVWRWSTLIWTPTLTVALLAWTRRYAPGAMGSGVPQVMLALDERTSASQRARLVSLRLSLHKIGLVAGGLLAGLSIGREGPAVQVGAGAMLHARRWLSPRAGLDAHSLMVAGAAAGIAAAFNTPLGGIAFALEQLSHRRNLSHSALMLVAILSSAGLAIAILGDFPYFGELRAQRLTVSHAFPGLLVIVITGLSGGLFARLLVASTRGMPDRFSRWRAEHPLRFAAGCSLAVALIGIATHGATTGTGYVQTRALLEGGNEVTPTYSLLKFCATWLSTWVGVPAGVFAPSLAIGAGIGRDVANICDISGDAAVPLIALGMVSFLAATTQGPITAFIIVMEMVGGHAMVLSLMAAALLSSGVARRLTRPLYSELAAHLEPSAVPGDPSGEDRARR